MQRFRFLLSRRWGFFLVAVLLLTWLAVALGQWQFDRLDARQERNASIVANEKQAAVPVQQVLAPGKGVAENLEWRTVTAKGVYLADETVVVRYRTGSQGEPGVQVIVPLALEDGTVVLVDRGWWPTHNRGEVPDDIPSPPTGTVTVSGWVRADATGDSTTVTNRSTRAVNSAAIGETLDAEVLTGFMQVSEESPAPEQSLTLPELPELGEGPHFFYGIQWWFFGVLAIAGFGYLVYDEYRDRQAEGAAEEHAADDDTPQVQSSAEQVSGEELPATRQT